MFRRYILDTDGRSWAKPKLIEARKYSKGPENVVTLKAVTNLDESAMNRCGGVDAGPYGLLHRRRQRIVVDEDTGVDVPYFDNDTRPHSLVLPWRPRQPLLFGVRNDNCYRALFDYCSRIASQCKASHTHAFRKWINATVLPLVSPEADRWYPALWGATLAAQQLDRATTNDTSDDYSGELLDTDILMVPNGNFYAFIVLASALVCWTVALCITLYDRCVQAFSRT